MCDKPYSHIKMTDNPSALISPDELNNLILTGENIILLDATYGLPGHPVTTQMRFEQKHIAGAQYFDIDVVAAPDAPMPHTIPSPAQFERHARDFGIDNDTMVVIYDQTGFWMAAARAWWMFRLFGHDNVKVLNGGLRAWESNYLATEQGKAQTRPTGNFIVDFRPQLLKTYDEVHANIESESFQLLDARPQMAFDAGHIKGSVCTPFPDLINHASGTMKSAKELQAILAPFIQNDIALATSCGSGVTACVVALALYETGKKDVAVYDGSWMEWSHRS